MEQIHAHGYVTAYRITPEGYREFVDAGRNTLSYGCADANAALFAGDADWKPSKVVFVCASASGKEADFHFDPSSSTKRVQDEETILGARFDALDEVDLDPNPKRDVPPGTAEGTYTANRVTFTALTKRNDAAVTVYGFLLKAANGKVLATRKLTQGLPKTAGYALAVTWAVTFN